jgi:hypothetical protein
MRRNQRAEAAVEPSWWSHDSNAAAPPDHPYDLDHSPSESGPEAQPLPLLTHPASLRIVEPDQPLAPALEPVTPQAAEPEPTPMSSAPTLRAAMVADSAAVQLATCYAIDHLSWDASNPGRRAAALARYLPTRTQPGGWSGRGRQRASFAVAGTTHPDDQDPTVVWIDVRVLITCYEPDPDTNPRPSSIPGVAPGELASEISSAPTPDAPGWRALDSDWVHIVVPLTRNETGQPRVRPDLTPTTYQPEDLDQPGLAVVPAPIPTEGK